MSWFSNIELAPPDPTLGTSQAFDKDKSQEKLNLCIESYRTDEGRPYVFSAVREAEQLIFNDPAINKEYLPSDGIKSFRIKSRELILGSGCPASAEERVVSA